MKLAANIKKLYTLKFFTMFLVLMPIIVPFFQSKGIGMSGVYLLQSVFAATVFVMEIPSGYISDLLGRKNTLVVSSILKGIGFTLFPLSTDLNTLIIAEVILGVAVSLNSGTDIALIYDTLEAVGSKKAKIKILGRTLSYQSLGEACAALIASLLMLITFDMQSLAIISACISWVPFFISLTLIEPTRVKMQNTHRENFSYIFENLFKKSKILRLIMLNSIVTSSGTLFAVWLFQKYWDEIDIPIIYFGFLWALTNFVVSVVSKRAHKIEKKIGSINILILIGVLPIVGYLGIAYTTSYLGVLFCLCFQVTRGLGQIVLKDALNKRVTADFRATANSISQMGVRILFMIFGPLLGFIIDEKGLSFACLSMGLIYIGCFFISSYRLILEQENFERIR